MSTFEGIVVYKIFPNGCLNGVYSNDHLQTKNEIFNEIAKKIDKNENKDEDEILGIYACSYMDSSSSDKAFTCDLEIKKGKKAQYDFTWYESGQPSKIKFIGIGWRTNKNQIAVSYNDL